MTTFTIHTVESAPAEVKEVLETVEKDNNGYIPNLIGLLANAPTALEAYRTQVQLAASFLVCSLIFIEY